MKTQIMKKMNAVVAVVISMTMTFTQIVPAGWAGGSELDQNAQGSVVAVVAADAGYNPTDTSTYRTTKYSSASSYYYVNDVVGYSQQTGRSYHEGFFSESPLKTSYDKNAAQEKEQKQNPALDEAESVFGQRPARSEVEAMSTGNSDRTTTRFYDEENVLIGTKTVVSIHPLGPDGINPSNSTTTVTWTDADGNIINLNQNSEQSFDSQMTLDEYHEKVQQLDEIMSGFARGGVTVGKIEGAHNILSAMRDLIVVLLENGEDAEAEALIKTFENRLDQFDQVLTKEPVVITLEYGQQVEVDLSEAARILGEEFRRLTGNEGIDYARLPGVSSSDVEGLETFQDYLNFRQIGVTTSIPVFEALSSYGTFQLIVRLVQKYGAEAFGPDADIDGIHELDFSVFRRLVNGTEAAYRQAEAAFNEIVKNHPVTFFGDTVTFTEITEAVNTVGDAYKAMNEALEQIVNGVEGEDVFKDLVRSELNKLLQDTYQPLSAQVTDHLAATPSDIARIINQHIYQQDRAHAISVSVLTYEEIETMLEHIEDLQSVLIQKLTELMGSIDGTESNLVNRVRSILLAQANGGYTSFSTGGGRYQAGYYAAVIRDFNSFILNKSVVFDIAGAGKVTMSAGQLTALTSGLPSSIQTLLKFPGIQEDVYPGSLYVLEKQKDEQLRAVISVPGPAALETPDTLSSFAKRIQLTKLLLSVYSDIAINNGQVNLDALRREILMNDLLETLYGASKEVIRGAIQKVDQIADAAKGVSLEEYEALYELISKTNGIVVSVIKLALDGVIYEARSLVREMLQNDFNQLLSKIDGILNQGRVRVSIGGTDYIVDSNVIHKLMASRLDEVAVKLSNNSNVDFNKGQYARLNLAGLSEDFVKNLMTSYERDWSRQISFETYNPSFSSSANDQAARQEIWFRFIPELLEAYGAEILDSDGNMSLSAFESKLFEGVHHPVQNGESVLEAFKKILRSVVDGARYLLNAVNYSDWAERIKSQQIIFNAIAQIKELSAELSKNLNASELSILQSFANTGLFWDTSVPNLRQLWDLLSSKLKGTKTVHVVMDDGTTVEVNLSEIESIPNLPKSFSYDQTLFPGLTASDFEGAYKDAPGYIDFSKIQPANQQLVFDVERLIINAAKRIYNTIDELPAIYRDRMFTDGKLNREIFRRYIKGVDALHADILDYVNNLTGREKEVIERMLTVPVTVESIRAVYDQIGGLRAEIMDYLNALTARHEKQDVIEMEEDVTKIYQATVDLLIDYMRSNVLTYQTAAGVNVQVPVHEITNRMIEVLKERFPGEDIAAHHFASFFGVNMDGLRSYNKLEEFLGMQIIALPRNSQYVEIVSKLSEIGMMEMIADLLETYENEIINENGDIDVDRLIELLSNKDEAVRRAMKSLSNIGDEAVNQIQALDVPLTSETFKELISIVNAAKLKLVNAGSDAVPGFDQEMFDQIQTHINGIYTQIKEMRDALVLGYPIKVTAVDGTVFEVNLTELEHYALARIWDMIPIPVPADPTQELIVPVFMQLDTITLARSASELVSPTYYELPVPVRPIWYPFPEQFDPKDVPTQFGFQTLLIRLVEKFGSFAVDHNGQFSASKFLEELSRTDFERVQEKLGQLGKEAVESMYDIVDPSGNYPVTLENVQKIHELLNEARGKMLKAASPFLAQDNEYTAIASEVNRQWSSVVNKYEELLFDRELTLEIQGVTYSVDAGALVKIMREQYQQGYTELLDVYLEDKETAFEYSQYKQLVDNYVYYESLAKRSSAEVMEAGEYEEPKYPNLGQLKGIAGIRSSDLNNLDVVSKDQVKLVFYADPRELLKGQLNMRVFAPGANVQTAGQTAANTASSAMMMAAETSVTSLSRDLVMVIDSIRLPVEYPVYKLLQTSERALLFEVLPAILNDHIHRVVNENGEIDAEKFKELLSRSPVDLLREDLIERAEKDLDSAQKQIVILKERLLSAEEKLNKETAELKTLVTESTDAFKAVMEGLQTALEGYADVLPQDLIDGIRKQIDIAAIMINGQMQQMVDIYLITQNEAIGFLKMFIHLYTGHTEQLAAYIEAVKQAASVEELKNIPYPSMAIPLIAQMYVENPTKTILEKVLQGRELLARVQEEIQSIVYGDVTGDGTVSGLDAQRIARHLEAVKTGEHPEWLLDKKQQFLADVDRDHKVTYADLRIVSLMAVGLLSAGDLPVTYGDVSRNGKLSGQDAYLIMQHVIAIRNGEESPLDQLQQQLGDMDGDNKLTYADARIISLMAVGLLSAGDLPVTYGDVSRNGKLSSLDSSLIMKHVNAIKNGEESPLDQLQQQLADMDGDNKLTYADARIVALMAVGLLSAGDLPVTYGDVSRNGKLSSLDSSLIMKHVNAIKNGEESPLDQLQQQLADMDGDNKLTYADARIVALMVVELLSAEDLPVLYGDLSRDGTRGSEDISLVMQHVEAVRNGEESPLDQLQQQLADMDGDNKLTHIDARIMELMVEGVITESDLPVTTHVLIRRLIFQIIVDHPVNFISTQTDEGQARLAYYDLNHDGLVDGSDMAIIRDITGVNSEVFMSAFTKIMKAVRDEADERFDLDKDGIVSVEEQLQIRDALSEGHEVFQQAFDAVDTDRNGVISGAEAVAALTAIGEAFGSSAGDENFNEDVDFNGDGTVDFGDFGIFNVVGSVLDANAKAIVKAFNVVDSILDGTHDFKTTDAELTAAFTAFEAAFGSSTGDENFNADMDFDGSGTIDFGDLGYLNAVMYSQNAEPSTSVTWTDAQGHVINVLQNQSENSENNQESEQLELAGLNEVFDPIVRKAAAQNREEAVLESGSASVQIVELQNQDSYVAPAGYVISNPHLQIQASDTMVEESVRGWMRSLKGSFEESGANQQTSLMGGDALLSNILS